MSMMFCNPRLFWEWFQKHHEKFKYPSRLKSQQLEYWEKEMHSEMLIFCLEQLFTDITCDEPNNRARMIISAHGKAKKFAKLELCAEAAPDIEGWEFIGYYPPMSAEDCMHHNYPSVTTTPAEFWFSPLQLLPVNDRYNLELYVDKKVEIDWEVKGAATQIMYGLLGERTGGLCVRKVTVSHLDAVLPALQQSLLPMTKLPEYIQADERSVWQSAPGS
jgi:hypothetical protein